MVVAVRQISEQEERLAQMTLTLGELYFNARLQEDTIKEKENEIAEARESADYWRRRFELLASFASQQAHKKFTNAVAEELQERGGQ